MSVHSDNRHADDSGADFTDLYLRQSLAQTRPEHAGGAASPDILPWGTSKNPDPTKLTTTASWAQDPGVGLVPGVANYIYARTRNPGSTIRPGRMYLGAARPTYLCWPDLLIPMQTGDGKAYAELKVGAQVIAVSPNGFTYQPYSAGDVLASWLYTLEHPVKLPLLTDINGLHDFIQATPGYAQRSLAFGLETGDAGLGRYRHSGGYDQRGVAAVVVFELAWTDCPLDWQLSLLPTAGGQDVSIAPFRISAPDGAVMCRRVLPAGFASTLEFAIDAGTIAPNPDSRIDIQVSLQIDLGAAGTGSDSSNNHSTEPRDSAAAQGLFRLGGHSWRARPPQA